jgi:MFS family permease
VTQQAEPKVSVKSLPRNVWAASGASFFTDVSSEMILNLVPLFLSNVLGVKTAVIGLIEGVAETTSSLIKLWSGSASDRVGRKWLAVSGYAISTLAKPAFALAGSWGTVAAARWADRAGKGVRTAPRDALVADSIVPEQRGLAFGFHRAADTGGALLGLLITMGVVWSVQGGALSLDAGVFKTLVWLSIIPAAIGVAFLAIGAREVRRPAHPEPVAADDGSSAPTPPSSGFRSLGRPFAVFLGIVAIFELGNSSDAFLVLRAQERGLSVMGILAVLAGFNLVYALVSVPAGRLSDRVGRRPVLVAGWALYALVYLGFALADAPWHSAILYALYGAQYGLTAGSAKAMVADLVPAHLRGTAYGGYNATVGLLDLPASILAGVLWQGVGSWSGLGPAAPFVLGAALAGVAAIALWRWRPPSRHSS